MVMTSGSSSRASDTARLPSPARPTTSMRGSWDRSAAIVLTMVGESSTTSTRMGRFKLMSALRAGS
jgi:hypothetical protein